MMSVARLLSYIKALFRRGQMQDDLTEELQFHLQNDIKKNIASGMTLEDARYAALRRFGGVDQVKEHAGMCARSDSSKNSVKTRDTHCECYAKVLASPWWLC